MGKSVMSSVRTPKRRAMSAWPNSWSTTEAKIASISNVLRRIAVAPWPATRPLTAKKAIESRALLTGRLHGLFLDSGGCFDLSVTTILRSPLLHCPGDVDLPTD
jgi:hypothetical protein